MDKLTQARTKKKEFLEQMDQLIPWGKWVEEIRPCYYKGERRNKSYGIELMLRLYVFQEVNGSIPLISTKHGIAKVQREKINYANLGLFSCFLNHFTPLPITALANCLTKWVK